MSAVSKKYLNGCDTEVYDITQVQILLQNEIQDHGITPLAKKIGVRPTYLGEISRGEKPPYGKVLKYLGFESVILYRRTE